MTEAPSVAVAIPAHNESEGIGEFLAEIDAALAPAWRRRHVRRRRRPRPPTGRPSAVEQVARQARRGDVVVDPHRAEPRPRPDRCSRPTGGRSTPGPSSCSGRRRRPVPRQRPAPGARAARGRRRRRLRRPPLPLRPVVPHADDRVRAPLRRRSVRRADPRRQLPAARLPRRRCSTSCCGGSRTRRSCPNLYLTILAARRGATLVEVDVNHRVRRGTATTGTMFSASQPGAR